MSSSYCHRWPWCGCGDGIGSWCHLPDGDPKLSENLDATKKLFADIEQKKREEQARQFLPYPTPHNRAQRRANERHLAKIEKEKELTVAVSQFPFKWKKGWKKVQNRKGGAKRIKR